VIASNGQKVGALYRTHPRRTIEEPFAMFLPA